jgi:hypothetical protein
MHISDTSRNVCAESYADCRSYVSGIISKTMDVSRDGALRRSMSLLQNSKVTGQSSVY